MVTPKTLLWMVSQAGHGPEAMALLDALAGRRPNLVLATTNQADSPLAARADLVLPLHTTQEHGVATRSYVNTLAVTQLTALAMTGQDVAPELAGLGQAAEALAAYLGDWQQKVEAFAQLMPEPDRVLLVGRGASLAAALDGALVLKEAARVNAEGMSAGQFRHGPLELADERLTVLIFDGGGPLRAADQRLAQTVSECGGRALWVGEQMATEGAHPGAQIPTVPAPTGTGIARPIGQIIPIQLLSLYLARLGGFEAAAFRHLGKVTWPELQAPA